MNRKRMAAAGIVAGGLVFSLVYFNPSVSYNELAEAHNDIKGAGFLCTADRADGKTANAFLVSRTPITWDEANKIWKSGNTKDDWTGKVWVARNSAKFALETSPNDQPPRVWGRVLAFGDPQFLDEIEGQLKRTRRFGWL